MTMLPPPYSSTNKKDSHQLSTNAPPSYDYIVLAGSDRLSRTNVLSLPSDSGLCYSQPQPASPQQPFLSTFGESDHNRPPSYFNSQQEVHLIAHQRRSTAYNNKLIGFTLLVALVTAPCTGFTSLICIVPALVFLSEARCAQRKRHNVNRDMNIHLSIFCNFLAVFWLIITVIAVVIISIVVVDSSKYFS